MTDENAAQQDSNQNGLQQIPEGMVENVKELQGAGLTATGDPDQQGKYSDINITRCS